MQDTRCTTTLHNRDMPMAQVQCVPSDRPRHTRMEDARLMTDEALVNEYLACMDEASQLEGSQYLLSSLDAAFSHDPAYRLAKQIWVLPE